MVNYNTKIESMRDASMNNAGFWKRMWAYFIDSISFYLIVPIFISLYTYFTQGQTLWKIVMWIKIVDVKSGNKPTWMTLFGRCFAKIISAFPLYLGFLWIWWDKKKQWWHDKICDTNVVEIRTYSPIWTWLANTPVILMVVGYFATIVLVSYTNAIENARDAQRSAAVNSLARLVFTQSPFTIDISQVTTNTPQNREEILNMIQSHSFNIPLDPKQDRCYFYIVKPWTSEFLFLVSWEAKKQNRSYELYMAWNYPEIQKKYANGLPLGQYLSCSMKEPWYINLN